MSNCERKVIVKDTRPPVIQVKGDKIVRNVEAGVSTIFEDPGVDAYDRVDGDMIFYHAVSL